VIKSGLSPLLIDLMQRGWITHIAGNGAVSIHDFELSMIGETSEYVPRGLEDGSFGMAYETGATMLQAIREGTRDGLGYGSAIGRFIAEHLEIFPHREIGVLYKAYTLGIATTIHITVGADIIHQHPSVDFAALGAASGLDFTLLTTAVADLEGGVYLNFGSAVTGAEVFLKALTIARNLGYPTAQITTANFDLVELGDYHSEISQDEPAYYYRPRKNIINRPTSLGGEGYHITGYHHETIPNIHHKLLNAGNRTGARPGKIQPLPAPESATSILQAMVQRQPQLEEIVDDLLRVYRELVLRFTTGGTLFLCGNGGSMADALHISGELLKSYAQPRRLPAQVRSRLAEQPHGSLLTKSLEPGLRAVVLGANMALSSAVENDMADRDLRYAQELLALGRPGDALWGISTSGNARSVVYAAETARALGLTVIGFSGADGGRLATLSDIAVRAPAQRTDRIQEYHISMYHALCEMLETTFFEEVSE
jgi:phosphoheptose isomerase